MVDDKHHGVQAQALEWQQRSGDAWFWEMASAEAEEGAAYALAGQMASVGEQVALAYSAGVEVALWQQQAMGDDFDVVREMSMRAMAEAQSLFVIGAGHALANVAVRALTLRTDLKAQLVKSFTRGSSIPTFEPFSQKPADWVSLNKEACKKLISVARASGSENIASLVAPVASYGRGSEWRALVDRRGEDFHRWRPQTHGLQGIPPKTPWRHTPPSAGSPEQRVLPLGQPVYEDARGLADEVARVATDGMFALADAMERFMDGWTKTSHELGGPTYKSSD